MLYAVKIYEVDCLLLRFNARYRMLNNQVFSEEYSFLNLSKKTLFYLPIKSIS